MLRMRMGIPQGRQASSMEVWSPDRLTQGTPIVPTWEHERHMCVKRLQMRASALEITGKRGVLGIGFRKKEP